MGTDLQWSASRPVHLVLGGRYASSFAKPKRVIAHGEVAEKIAWQSNRAADAICAHYSKRTSSRTSRGAVAKFAWAAHLYSTDPSASIRQTALRRAPPTSHSRIKREPSRKSFPSGNDSSAAGVSPYSDSRMAVHFSEASHANAQHITAATSANLDEARPKPTGDLDRGLPRRSGSPTVWCIQHLFLRGRQGNHRPGHHTSDRIHRRSTEGPTVSRRTVGRKWNSPESNYRH